MIVTRPLFGQSWCIASETWTISKTDEHRFEKKLLYKNLWPNTLKALSDVVERI